MPLKYFIYFCLPLFFQCKTGEPIIGVSKTYKNETSFKVDFTVAFGSCNKVEIGNRLWDDIINHHPDLWIWGGDNIYADTDNVNQLRQMYNDQNHIEGYSKLRSKTPIIGTWDDHDYGVNDGGAEFEGKKASQQEFLNFMGVPQNSSRRQQNGIYTTHEYKLREGIIKVIVLDTRYFRTPLTPDTETKKRTKPNPYGEGTLLGEAQWRWLKKELEMSKADFNIIVSSIQVLSNQHGFETWGNFPHEVDRLEKLIVDTKAAGVILLSGDRHIAEFSRTNVNGLSYPLIDFTSSGLTHAYKAFKGEQNPYRVGEVVFTENFGLLQFDLKHKRVVMKIIGDQGEILGKLQQVY
ncbi:alkaline phosphatase D family protein [Pareuzebyella sediminis]|uniref:alkaline phosphatase D family protein n=1 Tax=Pareuzebyella sediminis TaxID=2607998 RepID=UPI0011EDB9CC|nr:alkaline phosphatase D family protein [Pareuzebyella sediminis]